MAKPVVVTIEHRSSKEAVKARLRASLGQIRAQLSSFASGIEEEWSGDEMRFRLAALGQMVAGTIAVDERLVRVEVMLPGLLGAFGRMIAARVHDEATLLLEKK